MSHKSLPTQGYPLAEEIANSISHGLGCLFGIVGLMLLLDKASVMDAGLTAIISSSLYGGSMILLFLASTLYHAVSHPRAKRVLKKVDHCAIYLLIAGTYTPFLMVGLQSPLAYGLMAVIWGLALLGIIFKLTIAERFKVLSLVTYLCMGWLSLIVVYQLAMKLSAGGIWLLASGGIIYSLGVIFYVARRVPFNHAIWHAFV
ncbi:PAQR family membrane homeostasis protein TrhA, partial [Pantoea ananatis]